MQASWSPVAAYASKVTSPVRLAQDLVRERRRHRPVPPASGSGLVLDVGCGEAPHPRADLVVDKYIADDFERGAALDISRPLVIADAEALPFADKAFAYVTASHVLEHATDPLRFGAELSRIGRAGFVQVPSREAELTFGWPFHPWLIDLKGGVLVFHGRDDAAAPMGQLFHRSFAESALFRLWFFRNRSRWHHSVEWTGELRVRVADGAPRATTAVFDPESTGARIRSLVPRGIRGPDPEMLALMRCPADQGTLHLRGSSQTDAMLQCTTCSRAYPVVETVPLLVAEAAR